MYLAWEIHLQVSHTPSALLFLYSLATRNSSTSPFAHPTFKVSFSVIYVCATVPERNELGPHSEPQMQLCWVFTPDLASQSSF